MSQWIERRERERKREGEEEGRKKTTIGMVDRNGQGMLLNDTRKNTPRVVKILKKKKR